MRKLDIEFVREQFEKESYKLLTKNYVNAHQKLRYKCPNGHIHSIIWNSWKTGNRCSFCYGNGKLVTKYIKSEFKKEGYILISEYKNSKQKLYYICPEGHKHSVSWNNWSKGSRCSYCSNHPPIDIGFIKSKFAKENYILLSNEYINSQQKLDYICSKGHKHSISWNNWDRGKRCPECIGKISKGEVQVRNFIESLGVKISSNDRNQIFNPETGNGLELDIFMPTLNKAVEYNGEYWHQDKSRDLLKRELCESKGIDLLTIWDKEWKIKRSICKNKIIKILSDV